MFYPVRKQTSKPSFPAIMSQWDPNGELNIYTFTPSERIRRRSISPPPATAAVIHIASDSDSDSDSDSEHPATSPSPSPSSDNNEEPFVETIVYREPPNIFMLINHNDIITEAITSLNNGYRSDGYHSGALSEDSNSELDSNSNSDSDSDSDSDD